MYVVIVGPRWLRSLERGAVQTSWLIGDAATYQTREAAEHAARAASARRPGARIRVETGDTLLVRVSREV